MALYESEHTIFMREMLLSNLWRSPEKWSLEPERIDN